MARIHDGHRSRMRMRLQTEGLSGFQPHEALELLLYTVIPLRDVNPLAHALLDRFGSLSGVLNADREALLSVPGVGERTAEWLHFLADALGHYTALKLNDRPRLGTLKNVITYCGQLLSPDPPEQLWVFSMNMAGHLLNTAHLSSARDWTKSVSLRQTLEPALRYHAKTMVLVQKRPPTDLTPRKDEVAFMHRLAELLADIGVALMDVVLIGGRGAVSMRAANLLTASEINGLNRLETLRLYERWLEPDEN